MTRRQELDKRAEQIPARFLALQLTGNPLTIKTMNEHGLRRYAQCKAETLTTDLYEEAIKRAEKQVRLSQVELENKRLKRRMERNK